MKVKGHTSDYTMRRAIRGAAIVVEHPRGYVAAQAWPHKRGPTKRPAEQANRDTFRQAMQVIKQMPPQSYVAAIEGARGTAFLPRDLMMMACYGLLVTAVTKDGRVIQGARMVTKSIAAQLDSITATPGAMLYRSSVGWVEIVPATDGKVLTFDGPLNAPVWADATGSGAGGWGLWNKTLTAVPSSISTGLTTWYHQQTSPTADDAQNGIALRIPTVGSAVILQGRMAAAPPPPYTLTALVSHFAYGNQAASIGWTDGTKADVLEITSTSVFGRSSYAEVIRIPRHSRLHALGRRRQRVSKRHPTEHSLMGRRMTGQPKEGKKASCFTSARTARRTAMVMPCSPASTEIDSALSRAIDFC